MPQLGPHFGSVPFVYVSAATNNSKIIYPNKCQITFITAFNVNAAARYISIYDVNVQSGTSGFFGLTPAAVFGIPGNTAGAGTNIIFSPSATLGGLEVGNGLAMQITPNLALADMSAVGAGDVLMTLGYRY